MRNPFKKDSTQYIDFETMSDLKWHCTKCELKSGQAKTWQVWRQEKGIQLDKDENGNYYKKIFCKKCNQNTIHRKLKSLEILDNTKSRINISKNILKKIKEIYNNEEAVFLRKLSYNELEVDHKFPQIRWKNNEEDFSKYSNEQLKDKFILLSRSNNLLKSRYCEKCFKTGKRGSFPGIEYWYEGNENWGNFDKYDCKGCVGCFWNNPYKWRERLKELLEKNKINKNN